MGKVTFTQHPFNDSFLSGADAPPYTYHFTNNTYFDIYCVFTFHHENVSISNVGPGSVTQSTNSDESVILCVIPPAEFNYFVAEFVPKNLFLGSQILCTSLMHPGNPNAIHNTSYQYLIPFNELLVTIWQSWGGSSSHSGRHHYSIVFAVAEGTEVLAARDGIVCQIKDDIYLPSTQKNDKGNVIVIRHDDGTYGVYGHLLFSGSRVKFGQHVKRGDLIAHSGNSGSSEVPCLHFHVQKLVSNDVQEFWTVPIVFHNNTEQGFVPPENCVINTKTFKVELLEEEEPIIKTPANSRKSEKQVIKVNGSELVRNQQILSPTEIMAFTRQQKKVSVKKHDSAKQLRELAMERQVREMKQKENLNPILRSSYSPVPKPTSTTNIVPRPVSTDTTPIPVSANTAPRPVSTQPYKLTPYILKRQVQRPIETPAQDDREMVNPSQAPRPSQRLPPQPQVVVRSQPAPAPQPRQVPHDQIQSHRDTMNDIITAVNVVHSVRSLIPPRQRRRMEESCSVM
jgi:murein DD-endopeptidase MepM/ murein hydrolase activator NlpD